MPPSRWSALGNVYAVVEVPSLDPKAARELAAGTDGVVQVLSAGEDELEVAIWNPDGSLAELSGNGTRIAARWLAERTGASAVTVRVGDRAVRARMLGGADVEQDLGLVEVGAAETLRAAGEDVEVVPVSVGNPHAVVFREPLREDLLRLGPALERHRRFPARTNVQLARADGRSRLTALVWERGVGETPSSGTSAVAVAAAALATARCDEAVAVAFPGGTLRVRLEGARAYLTGPAEELPAGTGR